MGEVPAAIWATPKSIGNVANTYLCRTIVRHLLIGRLIRDRQDLLVAGAVYPEVRPHMPRCATRAFKSLAHLGNDFDRSNKFDTRHDESSVLEKEIAQAFRVPLIGAPSEIAQQAVNARTTTYS